MRKSSPSAPSLDIRHVRDLAQNQWFDILSALGMDAQFLKPTHGPCPFCGGKDRWRWDNRDGHGTAFCSQCLPGADGFAVVARLLGLNTDSEFPTVLTKVAAVLGAHPQKPNTKPKAQPERNGAVEARLVMPVPLEAPPPPLVRFGVPHGGRWEYRSPQGQVLFLVDRYDREDGGKSIMPLCLFREASGALVWRWKGGIPKPWPLYGLDRLAAAPDLPVVVCEGEKAVDAARRMLGNQAVVITSPNGATNAHLADWSPVQGRRVVIWPDNDPPGEKYAGVVREKCLALAASVQVVTLPDGLPPGWDAADGEKGGMPEGLLAAVLALCHTSSVVAVLPTPQPINEEPVKRVRVVLKGHIEDRMEAIYTALGCDCGLFVWGGSLASLSMVRNQVQIESLDAQGLQTFLSKRLDFYMQTADGDLAPKIIPLQYCNYILSFVNRADWPFPRIEQVIRAPVFGKDGSLSVQSGFHAPSMAYLELGDIQIPAVSEIPTREELQHAISLLWDFIWDFPFADDASMANTIAMAILPFIRPMVDGPTPLFLISAPTQGTGKTMLVDAISMVATGMVAASLTEGRDDDEWRKRITSVLVKSPAVIKIDNVNRKLDTGALASVLTSRIWEDRVLGSTKNIQLLNEAVWVATANNPVMSGEIARRVVWIRLNPTTESPWSRTGFRHDPLLPWVEEYRGILMWACLILVRHWMACGAPMGNEVLGSFERWAKVTGGILRCAGIEGFMGNRALLHDQADQESTEWRSLCEAWWETFGPVTVGIAELYSIAERIGVLESVMGDGNERSRRICLGKAMTRMIDRVFGQWRVSKGDLDSRNRTVGYRLVENR